MGDATMPEEVRRQAVSAAFNPYSGATDNAARAAEVAYAAGLAAGEDRATARIVARLREVGGGSLGPKPDTMSQDEFDSGLSLARALASRIERDSWGRA